MERFIAHEGAKNISPLQGEEFVGLAAINMSPLRGEEFVATHSYKHVALAGRRVCGDLRL